VDTREGDPATTTRSAFSERRVPPKLDQAGALHLDLGSAKMASRATRGHAHDTRAKQALNAETAW